MPLPRRVTRVRRPARHLPPCVEVEQLGRHLLDRGPRAVALLRPPLAAEAMQPRRRRIRGDIARRPIPLELVDAVEWHVEAVATLVLDHRHFDRALLDEDRLDPAVDPDAVLEMHDVVATPECGNRLERDAATVTARPPDAALAAEYLVVGENADTTFGARRRHDEPAIQHADGEGRGRRIPRSAVPSAARQ
jgi:hypothetical protein